MAPVAIGLPFIGADRDTNRTLTGASPPRGDARNGAAGWGSSPTTKKTKQQSRAEQGGAQGRARIEVVDHGTRDFRVVAVAIHDIAVLTAK